MIDVLIFVAGMLATILVAWYFYRKQRRQIFSVPLQQTGFTQEQLDFRILQAVTAEADCWRRIQTQTAEQTKQELEGQIWAAKLEERGIAQREAQMDLEQWKTDFEQTIRADAAARSTAVQKGKYTEQLAPLLPGFPFNPRDCRFLGSPIDFIVFDGMSDGQTTKIVVVEVKTGNSGLSARQRQIQECVKGGKVEWMKLDL